MDKILRVTYEKQKKKKKKEAFIKIEKITSNTKSGLGCNFLSFFYSILY